MLVSILHRVTGDGMALVGLAIGLWWLGALAGGPQAYGLFFALASSIPGQIVLVALSWAFFNHMLSGIRHFVLDIGAGYELHTNKLWALAVPVASVILTSAFWAFIYLK